MSHDNKWIRNPFDITAMFTSSTVSTEEKQQLTGTSTEYGLGNSFKNVPPINFWLGLRNGFPVLAGKAAGFTATYNDLCEGESIFLLHLHEH
jgi:hypothetical protein